MIKAPDLTGRVFERLTVISISGKNSRNKPIWLCKCVCGKEVPVLANNLGTGKY